MRSSDASPSCSADKAGEDFRERERNSDLADRRFIYIAPRVERVQTMKGSSASGTEPSGKYGKQAERVMAAAAVAAAERVGVMGQGYETRRLMISCGFRLFLAVSRKTVSPEMRGARPKLPSCH